MSSSFEGHEKSAHHTNTAFDSRGAIEALIETLLQGVAPLLPNRLSNNEIHRAVTVAYDAHREEAINGESGQRMAERVLEILHLSV